MRTPPAVVRTARFDHGTNGFNGYGSSFAHQRQLLAVVNFVFIKEMVVKTARFDHGLWPMRLALAVVNLTFALVLRQSKLSLSQL